MSQINQGIGKSIPNVFLLFFFFCFFPALQKKVHKAEVQPFVMSQRVVLTLRVSSLLILPWENSLWLPCFCLSRPKPAERPAVLTVRASAERCKPRAKRSTLETYRIFLDRSSNNNSAMATGMIRRRSGNLQTLLWKESVCLTCFHCMRRRGTQPSNIRL